jgi:hypothetical protein
MPIARDRAPKPAHLVSVQTSHLSAADHAADTTRSGYTERRGEALCRLQRAYAELLATAAELGAIDRELSSVNAMPLQTIHPDLIAALLGPHIARLSRNY